MWKLMINITQLQMATINNGQIKMAGKLLHDIINVGSVFCTPRKWKSLKDVSYALDTHPTCAQVFIHMHSKCDKCWFDSVEQWSANR